MNESQVKREATPAKPQVRDQDLAISKLPGEVTCPELCTPLGGAGSQATLC